MTTLAFLRTDALTALFILVCGALAWRLIWAILVTPRLNQVPPLMKRKEPPDSSQTVQVLLRDREPETEPEIRCIEVIDTREALPSRPTEVITPRSALPNGERRMVRRIAK